MRVLKLHPPLFFHGISEFCCWFIYLVFCFFSKLDSKIHSFNTSLQFLAYISCGSLSTKSARRVPDFWVVTSTLVLVLQLKTQKHHLAEMRWAEVCDDLSTESPVLLFWWKIGFLSSNQKKILQRPFPRVTPGPAEVTSSFAKWTSIELCFQPSCLAWSDGDSKQGSAIELHNWED